MRRTITIGRRMIPLPLALLAFLLTVTLAAAVLWFVSQFLAAETFTFGVIGLDCVTTETWDSAPSHESLSGFWHLGTIETVCTNDGTERLTDCTIEVDAVEADHPSAPNPIDLDLVTTASFFALTIDKDGSPWDICANIPCAIPDDARMSDLMANPPNINGLSPSDVMTLTLEFWSAPLPDGDINSQVQADGVQFDLTLLGTRDAGP